jgi:hypothetical protein
MKTQGYPEGSISNPIAAFANKLLGAWPRLRGSMVVHRANEAFGLWLEHSVEGENRMFHGVSGFGFEIDHVLISRGGVFAIRVERPAQSDSTEHGAVMQDPIEHAKDVARCLSEQLRERLGSWNRVHPVLLVRSGSELAARAEHPEVIVRTPKDFLAFLKNRPALLDHVEICQLSFAMSEVARDTEKLERHLKRTGQVRR